MRQKYSIQKEIYNFALPHGEQDNAWMQGKGIGLN